MGWAAPLGVWKVVEALRVVVGVGVLVGQCHSGGPRAEFWWDGGHQLALCSGWCPPWLYPMQGRCPHKAMSLSMLISALNWHRALWVE